MSAGAVKGCRKVEKPKCPAGQKPRSHAKRDGDADQILANLDDQAYPPPAPGCEYISQENVNFVASAEEPFMGVDDVLES